jgi:outer membrane protein OmpA-like peptidoglycan-associated protein
MKFDTKTMFAALMCTGLVATGCSTTQEKADATMSEPDAPTIAQAQAAVLTAKASAVCAPDKYERASGFLDLARLADATGDDAAVAANTRRAVDMADQVRNQYAILWPACEGAVAEKIDEALDEVSPERSVSIVVGVGEVDQGELNRVYFGYDSEQLDARDKELLYEVDTWLEENPGKDLVIEGHADERGSDAYNLALGERRAYTVKDFLVTMGADPDRLRVITYGEEAPVVEDADSPREYRKNRRVEFESENGAQ